MLDERIASILSRQHGAISRRQLWAAGLSSSGLEHRVRTHRLFPVMRGVYAPSPHIDAWGRRFAAVLSVGGQPLVSGPAITAGSHDATASAGPSRPRLVALSHWSVLHLHGLIEQPPARAHVTIEGTGGRPHADVHVHRARTLRVEDVEIVEGLPVTTPARTILDAALRASDGQVGRLIREAEYHGLLTHGAMADVVRRNPCHRGSARVRRVDPQTAESRLRQTPIEHRMAPILDRLPIGPPVPQLAVAGRSGRRYRADFAWPDLRLIVETDGRAGHERSTSFHSDRQRDADLAAAGWLTLRFTSLQLDDPEAVATVIRDTARTRHT